MERSSNIVVVVGGGPAGMRAAEVAAAGGAHVILCDAQPALGRKFLVAGRGGLNLTHGEPVENFPARYGAEEDRWRELLAEFGPDELRAWAETLGTETYVGTSGRVFPAGQKAAALLRAWTQRLRASGVEFRSGARLIGLSATNGRWQVRFEMPNEPSELTADAVVLALGGASWPETGCDGTWPEIIAQFGVGITPWSPANCGWNVAWPSEFLARVEGQPMKNVTVAAGGQAVSGELLITRYGLEGGAIYRLGRILRAMPEPRIVLDLKPQLSAEALHERLQAMASGGHWSKLCKLSTSATALLEIFFPGDCLERDRLVPRIKSFPLALVSPRPIAEAISSAGGIRWDELDSALMLRKMRGVFAAGEMIDWEAPTGGYLLQGCFSTGTRAGRSAAAYAVGR